LPHSRLKSNVSFIQNLLKTNLSGIILRIFALSAFVVFPLLIVCLGVWLFSSDFPFVFTGHKYIAFNEFVQKYLSTGKIKKIVYQANKNRAVAHLHENAVVDGRRCSGPVLMVYNKDINGQHDQFIKDIRTEESQLEIDPVRIDVVKGMTTLRYVFLPEHLFVGFPGRLVLWLALQSRFPYSSAFPVVLVPEWSYKGDCRSFKFFRRNDLYI
jgi:hypothetical protein